MNDEYDSLLFYDALSPEEQAALREELVDDPERAEALRMWQTVRADLHERLRERVPDRSLLVLYALNHAGRADLLTNEELSSLEAARPDLERALEAHPGLADVVHRIQKEQADFEAVWDEYMSAPERTAPRSARHVPDRRPVARSAQRNGRAGRRWVSRGAVALAAVAFIALMALLFQRDQAMVTVTAPDGSTRLVDLADGSTVRLAASATLTYPDPAQTTVFTRRAHLEGRAFFDVAHQQKSFIVETPTAVATVLGTSFGLDARDTLTTLTGVTGRVRFANRETQKRAVVVVGGQRSRVARNALPSTPAPVDVNHALDWTNLFMFRATTLSQITKRLSAFYDVQITVASSLAAKEVTGTFKRNRSVREVLHVLAATLQADVREQNGGYRLVPMP